jgi:hypothetical protein
MATISGTYPRPRAVLRGDFGAAFRGAALRGAALRGAARLDAAAFFAGAAF